MENENKKENKIQSESIAKLSLAMSKAQGEIKNAKKDSDNPYFRSKYADLASIWESCRAVLSKNELAVIQSTNIIDGKPCVITILSHSSGEWIKGIFPISYKDATPQAIGSGTTYARRYSLAAMVGVAPDDDDDGEKAMGRTQNQKSAPKKPKPNEPNYDWKPPTEETIDPSEYKVPIGKAKGKKLSELTDEELRGMAEYFTNLKEPPKGPAKELKMHLESFVQRKI